MVFGFFGVGGWVGIGFIVENFGGFFLVVCILLFSEGGSIYFRE